MTYNVFSGTLNPAQSVSLRVLRFLRLTCLVDVKRLCVFVCLYVLFFVIFFLFLVHYLPTAIIREYIAIITLKWWTFLKFRINVFLLLNENSINIYCMCGGHLH